MTNEQEHIYTGTVYTDFREQYKQQYIIFKYLKNKKYSY